MPERTLRPARPALAWPAGEVNGLATQALAPGKGFLSGAWYEDIDAFSLSHEDDYKSHLPRMRRRRFWGVCDNLWEVLSFVAHRKGPPVVGGGISVAIAFAMRAHLRETGKRDDGVLVRILLVSRIGSDDPGESNMVNLNEEAKFWMRLAAFAHMAEYLLSTGASLQDAEEILFGWRLPGSLPMACASLSGGMAYRQMA